MLLIPRRQLWTQQPQQAVKLAAAWRGRITSVFIGNSADPLRDEVTGLSLTATAATRAVSDKGVVYNFSGSGQYLSNSAYAPLTNNPGSVMVIFRPKAAPSANRTLVSCSQNGGSGAIFQLFEGNAGNFVARQYVFGGSGAMSAAAVTLNAWNTGFGVFRSNSDRSCYLNGARADDTTAISAVSGINRLHIGASPWAGPGEFWNGDIALVVFFNYAISDVEERSLRSFPNQIFDRPEQTIWVPVSVSGGTTIAPGSGHIALSGKTATVAQPNTVTPGAAHAVLAGHAPTVSQSAAIVVTPGAGHVALTGSVPGISQPRTVAPGVGHALLSGKTPIIVQAITLAPGSGHTVVAGKTPGVSQSSGMTLFPGLAHAVLSGNAPGIAQPNTVAPNTGHAVFTGNAPTVYSSGPLTDAEKIALILQILENRQTLNPVTGLFTLYADDGTTVLKTALAWEDTAATIPYRGQGLQRLDALQ